MQLQNTKNKKKSEDKMIERTFVAIKPDGVERGLVGEVIKRFEKVGLKISGMKLFWADKALSRKHYEEHLEKPFYQGLEHMITMGPSVAVVLEGVKAISLVRKMVGTTIPSEAAPGTIRGDYSHVTREYGNEKGTGVKNVVHASASLPAPFPSAARFFGTGCLNPSSL